MALKLRNPSGAASAPLILIEGGEKSGKSWAAAAFSASDKIGATYWIDLGEGSADEYGSIPGARYQIIEHNGTFTDIYQSVIEVQQLAQAAKDNGEKPVCLVIDSMSAEWDLLKDMANRIMIRRLEKRASQGKKVTMPKADEEIKIDTDIWNEVNSRHYKLMRVLMTFPGVVILTARGKEVMAMDANGRPIQGVKEYKVEGQKNLAFDVSLWVRFSREHEPMIIGGRSTRVDLRKGKYQPTEQRDLTIESLVFDLLGYAGEQVRDLVMPSGDIDNPIAVDYAADIIQAKDRDSLTDIYRRMGASFEAGELSKTEADTLIATLKTKAATFPKDPEGEPAPPVKHHKSEAPSQQLMKKLYATLREYGGLDGDDNRDARLTFFSEIVGYPVSSTKDLSSEEIKAIIFELNDLKAGTPA